jgi:hypothetical protein
VDTTGAGSGTGSGTPDPLDQILAKATYAGDLDTEGEFATFNASSTANATQVVNEINAAVRNNQSSECVRARRGMHAQ